jgi:hypothetical protein
MPVCGQLLLSGYWGEGRHAIGQSTMLLGRVRRARARIRRIRACRRPGHAERVEPEIAWPEKAGHVTVKALAEIAWPEKAGHVTVKALR